MYNGFLNVLKPSGMTSHDVVGKLRYLTKIKKVGHTGTLDPNAAGVLLIAMGNATKFSDYVMEKDKTYIGEIFLGKSTDTLDSYGEVVGEIHGISTIEKSLVEEAIASFLGENKQIPPKYSAIKIGGEKLYNLARKGLEISEIKPREIKIYNIELLAYEFPRVLIKVRCSSGTYIRTLATDIGANIGNKIGVHLPAYLSLLIRLKVGSFKIEDSVTLEEAIELIESKELVNRLMPVDVVLDKYKSIEIKSTAEKSYINGAFVSAKGIKKLEVEGLYKVYCGEKFLGMGEILKVNNELSLKARTQYQVL